MNIKNAAELNIKRLYHYQAFDKPERLVRIFTDGTIYFSNPGDFNDPWDCHPCYSKSALDDHDGYEHTVRCFVDYDRKRNTSLSEDEHLQREQKLCTNRKFLESMIDQMTTDMYEQIKKQYRVYCLSTHSNSTLMWSHYGSSHKGLCLEFSVQNKLFCDALPIEYIDYYPSFNVSDTDEDANLRPLLTKSSVWSYEDEFRIIATEPPYKFPGVLTTDKGFLVLPRGALQSVIVGSMMPEPDRDLVSSIVSESGWNVVLKAASLVPDRYALEIRMLK